MTVARSAPSSHSWHERDDGAERVILIRDGVWAPAMPFEQLCRSKILLVSEAHWQKVHNSGGT